MQHNDTGTAVVQQLAEFPQRWSWADVEAEGCTCMLNTEVGEQTTKAGKTPEGVEMLGS